MVAELLGACVAGQLVHLGTQAHVLLTQLHRLAEDRLEQVGGAGEGGDDGADGGGG